MKITELMASICMTFVGFIAGVLLFNSFSNKENLILLIIEFAFIFLQISFWNIAEK